MTPEILRVDMGLTVYGTNQVSYTVAGTPNVEFDEVVRKAAFRQVTAFEAEALTLSELVKRRKQKLQDLGDGLAVFKKHNAFKNDAGSDAKTDSDPALYSTVEKLCRGYWIEKMQGLYPQDNKMTRRQIMTAIQVVESEIDAENVELNQASSMLQTIISKRANAFSTASTLQRKLSSTGNTIIRGMLN